MREPTCVDESRVAAFAGLPFATMPLAPPWKMKAAPSFAPDPGR
jgi:hypothetical protein